MWTKEPPECSHDLDIDLYDGIGITNMDYSILSATYCFPDMDCIPIQDPHENSQDPPTSLLNLVVTSSDW